MHKSMAASGIVKHLARIHPAIRLALLIIGVMGLGVSLASLLISPFQESMTSVIWTLVLFALIAVNPLNGFLTWLIGHPFTEPSINIDLGRGIPDLSLARFCIGFLFILMLAQVATGRRKAYGITRVEFAFLLFAISFGASMVGVLESTTMLQILFDGWVAPLIVYFIIKNLITDRQKLHRMLNLLLIVGVYSAIYMFYEQYTGNVLFLPGRLHRQFYTNTSLRIVRGLYGTTLVFGALFNWLLPIAVHYFLKAPTRARKALYGLVIGLMLVGDFLTYKRTVWVAVVVSFLVMQWFYPQVRKIFIILVLLFAVVLAFTWDSVSQNEAVMERALNEDDWNTANGRIERWAEGWALWQQKPLFGHGFRRLNDPTGMWGTHNDYLHVLVTSGLAGFIPYMAFYIFILADSTKIYRQIGTNKKLFVDRELMVIFWGLYSTYFVMAMSGSGNRSHSMFNLVFFAIIGAIVGSQSPRLVQSERRKSKFLTLLQGEGN